MQCKLYAHGPIRFRTHAQMRVKTHLDSLAGIIVYWPV